MDDATTGRACEATIHLLGSKKKSTFLLLQFLWPTRFIISYAFMSITELIQMWVPIILNHLMVLLSH